MNGVTIPIVPSYIIIPVILKPSLAIILIHFCKRFYSQISSKIRVQDALIMLLSIPCRILYFYDTSVKN